MPLFQPVTLHTPRLVLRPLRETDAHAFFDIWSDGEAMRYFSFAPLTDPAQAAERVARNLTTTASGQDLVCVLEARDTGDVLGECVLFHAHAQCRRAEIGFSLRRRYWRGGYMREAAAAVLEHAFGTLRLNRIEADIDPRNVASAALLEKLGFVREGVLRERWIVGDEVSDSALYGLLASDPRG
ncbi:MULTISPECIES: GNAT family N-acetyltransferase [Burkholderia]|uniref:Acetyltransferase GCN5 n=1 Tax=Burkholderia anthina TaxID=179879 RepID=A0A6P2G7S5_9BURK|nr:MULTISPECIES: GNAT family N-acetyltransferase [Burkholderia]AXK62856.1 N-acetyltransferase [Burkholderia sp. IDO3]MBM2771019.1 GNAT family N-acetyltransferase [Burkholderia anthina]PCD62447.1 GNAT family N-acetyltransferase [Burkholderia sp. IDO3]VVU49024.1 acetyltransferase GCN5 [Burkholderia anthina]